MNHHENSSAPMTYVDSTCLRKRTALMKANLHVLQFPEVPHPGERMTREDGEYRSGEGQAVSVSTSNQETQNTVHRLADEYRTNRWEASWIGCHFLSLPSWLQDNDFLHSGHRPPLPSFCSCFKSIFRIHTETGNIWTHLIGCVVFIVMAVCFLSKQEAEVAIQEKLMFGTFFAGVILCLGLSCTFHTVSCHSELVGKLFNKLDYCGISLLLIGSKIPCLYYAFYCSWWPRLVYMTTVTVLGLATIVLSLWNSFSEPRFRSLRAGVFITFGLSAVVPVLHFVFLEGWFPAFRQLSLGWLILMASLYIGGALLYAMRVPERFFPGKCDIWFQSHQIFHIMVVAAALVHYRTISNMILYRMNLLQGECV